MCLGSWAEAQGSPLYFPPVRLPSGTPPRSRLAILLFLAAISLSGRGLATPASVPAPPGPCTFSDLSPLFVPIPATLGGVLVDPGCQYVYLTNTLQNRVEIYSLQTQSFEAPITVGLSPVGLDVTPAGNLLYVANSGEHTVSVIDLAQRGELRKINVPFDSFDDDKPTRIAIGSAGKAIIVSFGCCGGRIYGLTLASDVVTARTDYRTVGAITSTNTRLAASGDRSAIVLTEGGDSAGRTHVYRSQADAFDPVFEVSDALNDVSVDSNGSRVLIGRHGYALVLGTAPLSQTGTVTASSAFVDTGTGVHPSLPIGYRPADTKLEIYDLSTFLKIGERSIVNSVFDCYRVQ